MTAADGLVKARSRFFDAILLDVNLPDMYGVTVLRRLRVLGLGIPILMITGCYFEPEVEVEARAAGAIDFVYKPVFDVEQLADALRSSADAPPDAEDAEEPDAEFGIIGASSVMRDVRAWVKHVAPGKMSVLLAGETGTGKEVVARAIHAASGRHGPFVAVNCGAIPEPLFESELFGHGKGAFTGALQAKAGLAEEAHGGTLFLDEVGDMPLTQQVRLLRFLDRGELRRVGETRERSVDVRVIAATNRPLEADMSAGRFRKDLYFRLRTSTYSLPPLRDHPEDIEPLTRDSLARLGGKDGRLLSLDQAAVDALRTHSWPGNVRELRSVLEQAKSIAVGPILTGPQILTALGTTTGLSQTSNSGDEKRRRAEAALLARRWNATRAAKSLGISRATLYRWLGPRDTGSSS